MRSGDKPQTHLLKLATFHLGHILSVFSRDTFLSGVSVGNSVQGKSLAFITAEPPETFAVTKTNT